MVQPGGGTSNTGLPELLFSELQNWEAVLKSDPEVIHKLKSFDTVAKPDAAGPEDDKPAPSPRLRGPSL